MSAAFRETALERSWGVADVDQLLLLAGANRLHLVTGDGGILVHDQDPQALLAGLLRQARVGLILRERASANPGEPLMAAIANADDRMRRER
jgi:hypothetical protein